MQRVLSNQVIGKEGGFEILHFYFNAVRAGCNSLFRRAEKHPSHKMFLIRRIKTLVIVIGVLILF
jgi:hypothetical protein